MAHHFKKDISNTVVLYGHHAVFAALKNKKRHIFNLFCTPENEKTLKAAFENTPFNVVLKKEIEKLVGTSAVHQGYALVTNPLPNVSLEKICAQTKDKERCHVLILDQVTDVQNIGAIIRSAAAFGAEAIVVQDKNTPLENGAMAKASAGTIELIDIVRVTNLNRAIDFLKQNGFWIVGLDAHAKQKLDEIDRQTKLAFVLGSEGDGMRRLTQESCDLTVRLEINENVESLNVSNTAAIVLYELGK